MSQTATASPLIAALLLALTIAVGAPVVAQAQALIPASLNETESAELSRIASHLNTLTTMQARFTQIDQSGAVAEGDFYLSRPGRMRIAYDPPVPWLYVANGIFLVFYDAELEQRSEIPIGDTLADFVVREDISFDGDITVTGFREIDGTFEVDVVQTEDPGAGRLTLVFQSFPLQLVKWELVDAEGNFTQVWLTEARFGMALDRNLWTAPRPNWE